MDYYCEIEKVIDYIEQNIKNELSIEILSDYMEISKYHFQRLFSSIIGETVSIYIKKRRLTEAAIEIRNSRKNILEIAVEYGFNSHEVFSRAFKSEFGVSPSDFRKNEIEFNKFEKADVVSRKMQVESLGCLIDSEIVELEEKIIIGMECISESFRKSERTTKLWQEFLEATKEMKNLKNPDIHYNVLGSNFLSSSYIIFAGIEAYDCSEISYKIAARKIPAHKYAKFVHKAPMYKSITNLLENTVELIYKSWMPNSQYKLAQLGFEVMVVTNEKFFKRGNKINVIEIYIPVI